MNFPAAKAAVPAEGFLPNPKGRLKDQFNEVARFKHLSPRSEECYWEWVVRFLKFHRISGQWRHPRDLGTAGLSAFLSYLATDSKVSASTKNQALNPSPFDFDATGCAALQTLREFWIRKAAQRHQFFDFIFSDSVNAVVA